MGNVILSGVSKGATAPVGIVYLGQLAVGSIIKINENDIPCDYYVAKHDYESGLNGTGRTLLVRKEPYDTGYIWAPTGSNNYQYSSIHEVAITNYRSMLPSSIQSAMGPTKFYITLTNIGVREFSAYAFILSLTELGKTNSNANVEGSALPIANILQIAYIDGSPSGQMTRSTDLRDVGKVWHINYNGSEGSYYVTESGKFRPAFTLPANGIIVNKDGTVSVEG